METLSCRYQKVKTDSTTYIIDGLGGDGTDKLVDKNPESLVRYSEKDGKILVEASDRELFFNFITTSVKSVDDFLIKKSRKLPTNFG